MKFISSIVLLLAIQLISSKKTVNNYSIRNRAKADTDQDSVAKAISTNNGNNGGSGAEAYSGNIGGNLIYQNGNI